MASPGKPPRPAVLFDPVKLAGMAEPLTVRIERQRGNVRQSMPLPRRDGYAVQGQGWSKDEVAELEQWALGSFGGGTYAFTVTDASEPMTVMTWAQMWPVDQYPQKIPVALVSDQQMPPSMPDASMAPYGGAPPPGWQMPPSPPTINPSSFGAPMGGGSNWPSYSPPAWGYPWGQQQQGASAPREDFRREAEQARLAQVEMKADLARLADENRRLAAEAAKAQQTPREDPALKAQLEREREDRREERHRADLAALEARIAAANAKPAEDPRLAQLIEDNKRLAAEAKQRDEEHRRERDEERRRAEDRSEREAAERRHQESLAALRSEQQAAQSRLETLIAANAAPKTDPLITMVVSMMDRQTAAAAEQARLQADAAKEAARIQADAVKDQSRGQAELVNSLKPFMVAPMEMARMITDASKDQSQFTNTMTRTFADAFGTMRDTYRGMMEAMAGPSENPALRVIEGAMGSAKEMFERWTGSKAQSEVARMNAQRDIVTAQAQAMRPIMPHEMQQQPVNGNGSTQHAPAAAPTQGWQAPPPVAQQAPQQAGLAGVTPQADDTLRKGGRTDAQWFGTALPDVLAMREGIIFFIGSISMNPPRMQPDGRPLGIGPDQAAMLIISAAAQIQRMGVKDVEAFNYLFEQKMYDSLIDIILPEGFVKPELSKGFRDDTLQFLYQLLEGKQLNIPMPIPPAQYPEIMRQMGMQVVVPQAAGPAPMPATPSGRAEFPPGSEDADERDVVEVVSAAPPTAVPATVRPARQPQPAGGKR